VSMDNDNSRVTLGKLGAPYGIRGWVKIHTFTDNAEGIFDYSNWQLFHAGQWHDVEVERWRWHNKGLIAKLSCIADRNDAERWTNAEIVVDAAQLVELDEGEFYWRDLIGCTVVNQSGYKLGTVDDILETGSADVLCIKANANDAFGKVERMIPFIDGQFIKAVSIDQRQIEVDWDPGF